MTTFRDTFDLFVFDLDGTLVDSGRDIAASLNHALGTLDLEPLGYEHVLRCVGRGARVLLERALALNETTRTDGDLATRVDAGLAAFLEHYREECTRRTELYPGAAETLAGLADATLAIHTNKPGLQCEKILQHLGVRGEFEAVVDGDGRLARARGTHTAMDLRRKPAPDGLLALSKELGHTLDRVLLIGDTTTDALAARAAGVRVALVPYGFEPESAWEERPDYRLDHLPDLLGPLAAR
jgi:phosphoglycolate phosphatase